MKEIYLAGGCFWGVQKYLSLLPGVQKTQAGYANGSGSSPTYAQVCQGSTGYAEAVKVEYDPTHISLTFLLERFFEIIDPTSLNQQGNDIGIQYRTGIYYTNPEDEEIIRGALVLLGETLDKPVVVEVKPLQSYFPAEEYHQDYLGKNEGGYCHINLDLFQQASKAVDTVTRKRQETQATGKENLSPLQFEVTQNDATEPPFRNEYFDNFREGIYVDIISGEPLFISTDKFESGCGWPAFSKPIGANLLVEKEDFSHDRSRIEVRAQNSDSHLGHVFPDGPKETGGLRYCINSAALRFVPKEEMEAEGYGAYISHLQDK